ncbi:Monoterpene epsilon-lactone hydrolase [Microbacterium sp. TNHR37B]|nr:Monoterpene epsilon-lactone hydrolase [Microbacterium sp. TNHR37B]
MKLTAAALWLTAGSTRRDLSGSDYLQRVDPGRAPVSAPSGMIGAGELTESTVEGRRVWRWEPRDHEAGRELVYFPGGGFVNPLVTAHWLIIRRLQEQTKAAITIAQYPLIPEHTIHDARRFVDAVYDDVAARATTRQLFVAGDSAGGNVAATLALRIRDGGRRMPDGLVLLAPWVEVSMANPGAWSRQRRDPSLRCAGLRAAAVAWAAGASLDDPQLSPLRDSGAGLPPTLLFQGGRDVFHDDVVALAEKWRSAGTRVRLVVAEDGFHVYPGAFWTREARDAYSVVREFAADPAAVTR